MVQDRERATRTRAALAEAGLDALVCRLPENLVLLGGYWPVIGRSAIVMPIDGDPVLLAPAMEEDPLRKATVRDIRTFQVWHLTDPAPDDTLADLLRRVAADRRLAGKRIGIEENFEDITPTQKVLEPWAPASLSRKILADAFGERLVDATSVLSALRARKTPYELERVATAGKSGVFGLEAFFEAGDPRRREADIAAAVEHAVMTRGTGFEGVRHARAVALVYSGEARLSGQSWGYTQTSTRVVQDGDLVMIELSVVADGYYADLTRMRAVGRVSSEVEGAYHAVRDAQAAATRAVRPGAAWAFVDAAARDLLQARGFGDAFIHHTGHGMGFRYHEAIPFLHPRAQGTLEEGMVTSIEPGVYGPGYGGIRIEDDVAVGPTEPVILSQCSRELQ
jgi:Xaa-Pro dipeptidase